MFTDHKTSIYYSKSAPVWIDSCVQVSGLPLVAPRSHMKHMGHEYECEHECERRYEYEHEYEDEHKCEHEYEHEHGHEYGHGHENEHENKHEYEFDLSGCTFQIRFEKSTPTPNPHCYDLLVEIC